jgi:hypothetical protein
METCGSDESRQDSRRFSKRDQHTIDPENNEATKNEQTKSIEGRRFSSNFWGLGSSSRLYWWRVYVFEAFAAFPRVQETTDPKSNELRCS